MQHPQFAHCIIQSGRDRYGVTFDVYVLPNGRQVKVSSYNDGQWYGTDYSDGYGREQTGHRPLDEVHAYIDRVAELPDLSGR